MEAPPDVVPSVETLLATHDDSTTKPALTPPTSEDNDKRFERMSSELSELDSDDGEDIEPDHYFEGGKIPVFKPVSRQVANELHRQDEKHARRCCYDYDAQKYDRKDTDYHVYRQWISFATLSASSTRLTSME
jgi:hypothetical protein